MRESMPANCPVHRTGPRSVEVTRGASLDSVFSELASRRAQAVVVQTPNPVVLANRTRMAGLAQKARLPSIYGQREFAQAGASEMS
jgi:hypothetical protein